MAYQPATPATLKMRYPAFASVPDETIQYWLTDSLRAVDDSWIEGDRAVAEMALAAHNMTIGGVGGGAGGSIPSGVTRFKSGSFDVAFSDTAATIAAEGGYKATRYGIEFQALLRASKAGPRVSGGIADGPCNPGYNGYAGPLPPWVL
ncbi:DUF4054 domain-containing protein [Sphingomonas crocodyli]|uniref:DUF4054 domain-containing protein n=1 Tax=Sphingomonas crocodyli TaxID=1979270 RepID=A0A437M7R4_9SPHN|nr:DUF4054 domain-containing protein [Sphingomonas crocodyli]RVT93699.1 DUF4054 domain-containing protein [Sphingomonas crocodyli]